MPALPAVNHVIRLALIGTYGEDSDVVNRVYFQYVTPTTTPTDLNTVCSTLATAWNTRLAAKFHTSFTLTEVAAEDLTSSTSPVGSAITSHAGTLNGTGLTAATCLLIRNKIGRRYRGGHPRTYWAAGDSNQKTDPQTWSTTFTSGFITAWALFVGDAIGAIDTAYGASNSTQCNVSFYQGFTNVTYPSGRTYPRPTLRAVPLVDLVIGWEPNPKIASQRRRNLTP